MPTGGVDILAGAGTLAGAFGSAAPIIGAGLAGVEGGAALGGLEGVVTGGNIGKDISHGAIAGGLTGGGIGLGGDLLSSTVGTTAADAIGGAAGGALGGVATGQKPLTGALEGGASGALAGALSSSGTPSSTPAAAASGGSGVSSAGAAAPDGVTVDFGQPQADTNLSSMGSSLTNSPNVGSNTVGTQSLPNGVSNNVGLSFSQAADGVPSLSATGANTLPASLPAELGGAASPPANPAAPTSVDKFLKEPGVGTAFDVVKANPGAAISAAGLGAQAIEGSKSLEGERQLKSEAAQEAAQGNQLENYLNSGTLPPGLQAGLNQASESAKANIRSQYAARGMSGSSAEQQDLAAVDQRAQASGAEMAMQLLQTGISETGMSSQLYDALLKQATTQDSNLASSIANFASAAGGTGSGGNALEQALAKKLAS